MITMCQQTKQISHYSEKNQTKPQQFPTKAGKAWPGSYHLLLFSNNDNRL